MTKVLINWLFIEITPKTIEDLGLTEESAYTLDNYNAIVRQHYPGEWTFAPESEKKQLEILRLRLKEAQHSESEHDEVQETQITKGERILKQLDGTTYERIPFPVDSESDDQLDLELLNKKETATETSEQICGRSLLPGTFEYHKVFGLSFGRRYGLQDKKWTTNKTALHVTVEWKDKREIPSTEPQMHFVSQESLQNGVMDFLYRNETGPEEPETTIGQTRTKVIQKKKREKLQKQKKDGRANHNPNRECLCGCKQNVRLSLKNGFLIECPCFRRTKHYRSRLYRIGSDCWEKVTIICARCGETIQKNTYINQY